MEELELPCHEGPGARGHYTIVALTRPPPGGRGRHEGPWYYQRPSQLGEMRFRTALPCHSDMMWQKQGPMSKARTGSGARSLDGKLPWRMGISPVTRARDKYLVVSYCEVAHWPMSFGLP